jgi:c-di-GMP-binding flagellar brake protein YcgR
MSLDARGVPEWSVPVRVTEISAGGVRAHATGDLGEGARIVLRLHLESPLDLPAIATVVRPVGADAPASGEREWAFRFDGVSAEQRAILSRLVFSRAARLSRSGRTPAGADAGGLHGRVGDEPEPRSAHAEE